VQPTEKEGMTDGKRYIIDPEFRDLLPAKTPEQYNRLKEVIRAEGFRDDLVVWSEMNTLTDGHNRDQIYDELSKEMQIEPPKIIRMSFANRDAVKMWIIQNQLNRRNLKPFQRIEAVLHLKELFVAQAKANKQAGVPLMLGEGGETDKKLAELADSSPDIVRKATRILEKASEPAVAEAINALRRGEKRVTITSVYKEHCVQKQAAQSPSTASGEPDSESIDDIIAETRAYLDDKSGSLSDSAKQYAFYNSVIDWLQSKRMQKELTHNNIRKGMKLA
jgi:hypothetical protein